MKAGYHSVVHWLKQSSWREPSILICMNEGWLPVIIKLWLKQFSCREPSIHQGTLAGNQLTVSWVQTGLSHHVILLCYLDSASLDLPYLKRKQQSWLCKLVSGLATSSTFFTIFYKGDNFCDFQFTFPAPSLFWKGVYSNRKEFAPNLSFYPFSEEE